MDNTYHVGMADLVVVSAPAVLITLGLGSCIGLVIFDTMAKIAGMAHIMLPDSRGTKVIEKVGKFADTAVPTVIDEMIKKGASKSRMKAKIAGGAQMFALPGVTTDFLSVGVRNVKETTSMLQKSGISLVASDTGGNKGRTVEFSTTTWMLAIKTLGKGKTEI
ncbi:putative chemoreceptor glutamine deamidase CheD [Synergistales bacterium]|nr:putative chemoreceptor glutamine deamidase CheD [Synergistales bacterium]